MKIIGMRLAGTIFVPAGLLFLSASMNPTRAGDTYVPAENAGPLGLARKAARPAVVTIGDPHQTILGKPCLAYAASSRAHLVNKRVFDYVVAVTNNCPRSIRIRICQKDGSGCSGALVQAYRSKDVVMGFGPLTNTFDYIAKESP